MAKLKITATDPLGAAEALLKTAGVPVLGPVRRLDHGSQIRVTGAAITVFDSGTVLIQGPAEAALRPIFADAPGPIAAPAVVTSRRKVVSSELPLPELPSRRHPEWTDDPEDDGAPPF